MKVRLVMAAIAAISSVTCFGGLFDNALKAVSDTAKAVTASPAETREEAERARLKAVQEESERKEAERRKKIEVEESARRQQMEKAQAERKAKRDAEEAARKARQEQEEKNRLAKEKQDCQSRLVMACVVAGRGNDGNVYINASLRNSFKGSVQYEPNSLIRTHVPLYKEISSGSSIGWVIDNGYLSEKLGRINVSPFVIPEVNYRGCLFNIDEEVSLCCAVSKVAEKPIVEVFGMSKGFPQSTAIKEIAQKLQGKYQGLKTKESQETDKVISMDEFVGFSKTIVRHKIDFENDSIAGALVGEEFAFDKLDWDSDAASYLICAGTLGLLEKQNEFKYDEFKKAYDENEAAVRADVKSGKCKKALADFKLKFSNQVLGEVSGEVAYMMVETAKRTMKDREFWNKKDFERVKNEYIAFSSQMEPQLGQITGKRGGPRLTVYDKNAVLALVDAEKKKDDARKAKAQKKKEAENAAALDF